MGILLPIVRGGAVRVIGGGAVLDAVAGDLRRRRRRRSKRLTIGLAARRRTFAGLGVGPVRGRRARLEAFHRRQRDHHVDQVFDLGQLFALIAADEA